eukprot:1470492-Amphidinium_carterae.1
MKHNRQEILGMDTRHEGSEMLVQNYGLCNALNQKNPGHLRSHSHDILPMLPWLSCCIVPAERICGLLCDLLGREGAH